MNPPDALTTLLTYLERQYLPAEIKDAYRLLKTNGAVGLSGNRPRVGTAADAQRALYEGDAMITKPCAECKGSGKVDNKPCPTCGGGGWMPL